MHRGPLLALLEAHLASHPEDHLRIDHVRQFVRTHPDCFERTCAEGHITGSAWIVCATTGHVLLVHHRKLDRWLQPGGHADGDPDPLAVARREAEEESGLTHFLPVPGGDLPLDVDVHRIPARGAEPAHLHHDIRFLFLAAPDQTLRLSDESTALRWVAPGDLPGFGVDESVLRMATRAREILGRERGRKFFPPRTDTP